MKNYRTEDQFIDLMDSAANGNFSEAAKTAEEAGFYAQDLIEHYHNTVEVYGWDFEDLVYISQMAQELRKQFYFGGLVRLTSPNKTKHKKTKLKKKI